MATATVKERLTNLEKRMAQLRQNQETATPQTPRLKKIVGVYQNDPKFDEADLSGRE